MYSAENYFWGWVVYATGVSLMLLVVWYWMRNLGVAAIRHIVLLLLAVIFLTPVSAYPDNPFLAPAFFVSLFEGLFVEDGGYQRGFAPLLAVACGVLLLYGLVRTLRWWLQRRNKRPAVEGAPAEQQQTS